MNGRFSYYQFIKDTLKGWFPLQLSARMKLVLRVIKARLQIKWWVSTRYGGLDAQHLLCTSLLLIVLNKCMLVSSGIAQTVHPRPRLKDSHKVQKHIQCQYAQL